MFTSEEKLEAAMIMLDTMSKVMMDQPNWQEMAVLHRTLFDAEAIDPVIHAAGIAVAQELLEK